MIEETLEREDSTREINNADYKSQRKTSQESDI